MVFSPCPARAGRELRLDSAGARSAPRRWPLPSDPAAGCYESSSLRLTVRTPPTTLDCARTVDTVFFDAAYVRLNSVTRAGLFYTPRMPPARDVQGDDDGRDQSRVGIGVWLRGRAQNRQLGLRVRARGSVARARPRDVTPLLGAARRALQSAPVRDMAQRLTAAFEGARPPI